jgi:hypothetical protein
VNRRHLLLTISVAVALGTGLLALPGMDIPWLRALLGAPLVFLLPGYAVLTAFDPEHRLGRAEQLVASIGTSIALTVLIGLLLAWNGFRLAPASWIAALGGTTVVISFTAQLRLAMLESQPEQPTLLGLSSFALALWTFVLIIVGVTGAFQLPASTGRVVQLWALPAGASGEVSVTVSNALSPADSYRLRATQGDKLLLETRLQVPQGTSRTVTVHPSADSSAPVSAVLTTPPGRRPIRAVLLWPTK